MERTPAIDFDLIDILQSINFLYGRGTIGAYRLDSLLPVGIAYRRIPITQRTSRIETRRFRIIGRTVHFLRHQRRLPREQD